MGYRFQSTLPLRGATSRRSAQSAPDPISIHAPLAGSDIDVQCPPNLSPISIHAPLAGSDDGPPKTPARSARFQSTLPLRGATRLPAQHHAVHRFQSTLPLRGATASSPTHASPLLFQSTLPLRGATANIWCAHRSFHISIHAPLAGSDVMLEPSAVNHYISIHAPLAGSDPVVSVRFLHSRKFQSTLPLRGATQAICFSDPLSGISIHAPLAGSDILEDVKVVVVPISIHAPLAGSDPCRRSGIMRGVTFQSTLPLRGATRA